MATSKSKGGADIRFDEFIKHIRPQPNSTEAIVLVQGYVGESDKEGNVRVYSDESLSEYVDLPRTEILYSLANDQDPLGGSTLWVKQSAEVNYNDVNYGQGDMYSDYMQNTYAPEQTNYAGGAITVINCPGPVLTRPLVCARPSKLICPTPASRLVICTIQQTNFCPVTVTRSPLGCGGPSLVDGCPSALGCTIDTVINPGRIGGFAGEVGGGDLYGDYMQNMYDASGGASPAAAASNAQICYQPISQLTLCRSVYIQCITQQVWCHITPNKIRSICRPCYEVTPTITQTPQITPTIQGGTVTIAGGGGFAGDVGGGDLYGDYMQNMYDAAGTDPSPAAAVSNPQICYQPISKLTVCHSVFVQCVTRQALCWLTRNNIRTICRPCYEITPTITRTPQSLACGEITPTIQPTIQPGGIGGGGFAGDYGGGDIYGDYMQNVYDAGEGASPAAAISTPQICYQPISKLTVCHSVFVQCITRQAVCWLTRNNLRTICRPCYEITPTITRTPQSLACGEITPTIQPTIQPGGIGGGGFAGDYGGGDIYGDYMQNVYAGAGTNDTAAAPATIAAACITPTSPVRCRTLQLTQVICCRITVNYLQCRTRIPQFCVTGPTYCCPTLNAICNTRPPRCPIPTLAGCGLQTAHCPSAICGVGG